MRKNFRLSALTGTLLALALVAAACGDDDDEADSTTAPASISAIQEVCLLGWTGMALIPCEIMGMQVVVTPVGTGRRRP